MHTRMRLQQRMKEQNTIVDPTEAANRPESTHVDEDGQDEDIAEVCIHEHTYVLA